MRTSAIVAATVALLTFTAAPAMADSAKPGVSMTHIKTVAGLASTLESAGVVLFSQGGATSAVIGDSLAASSSQVVFHIPVTGTKAEVQHIGSTLVFFNTSNNKQVRLQNPVIDVTKGTVSAVVPEASATAIPVLTISNAGTLKPLVKTDRKAGQRTTTYSGVQLALAPGVNAVLDSLLGLPVGSLSDGAAIATADVTLNAAVRR